MHAVTSNPHVLFFIALRGALAVVVTAYDIEGLWTILCEATGSGLVTSASFDEGVALSATSSKQMCLAGQRRMIEARRSLWV